MVFRRKRKARARFFAAKRTRSRRSNGGILTALLGAGLYGAFRQKVSDYIAPYTAKIPLGNISDEVGMIGLAYIGNKFIGRKVPMASSIFKAGMIIESARIGEAVATGTAGLSMLGQSSMIESSTNIKGAGMNVYS